MRKIQRVTTAHSPLRQTSEFDGLVDKADLIALTGDLAGKRFTVRQRVVLGRDPEVSILVPGDDVSRRHAAIGRTATGDFVVEDLKSRNGTLVNGVPVELHVLQFGDKLQIGARTLFVFTPHSTPEDQLIRWQRIEVIGQMAAGVVHDFANYITAVLGQVDYLNQLMESGGMDESLLRRGLGEIQMAAQQGFKLTRKVLSFARSTDTSTYPVDLASVVDDAVRLSRRNIDDKIRVDVQIQPGLLVRGDRTEFLQVLINLLLNARDAMNEGGVLTVRGHAVVAGGGDGAEGGIQQIQLEVSDTGEGMDERTRKRIFEPLFTTKAPGSGTGLGLSTVARIVENHGGTIEALSAPGEGATFRILLPLA